MLKKMRRRFITSAMIAITAVVLVLVAAVNLWNYHLTTQKQDETLTGLARYEQFSRDFTGPIPDRRGGPGGGDFPMPGLFGGDFPEFRYSLRYFSVECDGEGNAVGTRQEFITSVSAEEARQWGEQVVRGGRNAGYVNGYRYLLTRSKSGYTAIFLNAAQEIQSMQVLLLVSSVVALVSLLVVFMLVLLLSKRAMAPFLRNIETQKRFITDAGHELKTPLTAIAASADILSEDLPGNEWVGSIRGETARMTKLVTNLVALSRLDEEQPFPEKIEFSLSDAVWEICEPMGNLARAKGKSFTQSIQDGLLVKGDRAAVQQMVSILLDNAVKYSSSDGVIRLELAKIRGKTQLRIFNTCDTGSLDVSRLFDRFYRPDSSRSTHTGGTGIGLSIAKATAQAHGGDIAAKAEDGGITFTIRL